MPITSPPPSSFPCNESGNEGESFEDFKFRAQVCPKCNALIAKQNKHSIEVYEHRWANGNQGSLRALNNLVCAFSKDEGCINPERKKDGGMWLGYDTWEKRNKKINNLNLNGNHEI